MPAGRGPVRAPLALLAMLALSLAADAASAQEPASAAPTQREIIPPTPLSELRATYPEQATGEAVVVLTLTVEPDGSVSGVAASQTNEPFSSQAVEAAQRFRFRPATRNGVVVRARIRVQIEFHPPEPAGPELAGAEPSPEKVAAPNEQRTPRKPRVVEIEVRGVKMDPSRTASLSRAEVRQIPGT